MTQLWNCILPYVVSWILNLLMKLPMIHQGLFMTNLSRSLYHQLTDEYDRGIQSIHNTPSQWVVERRSKPNWTRKPPRPQVPLPPAILMEGESTYCSSVYRDHKSKALYHPGKEIVDPTVSNKGRTDRAWAIYRNSSPRLPTRCYRLRDCWLSLLAKPDLTMWCLKDCLGEVRILHRASISSPELSPLTSYLSRFALDPSKSFTWSLSDARNRCSLSLWK